MGAFLQVWHWASKGWHSAGFVSCFSVLHLR